MLTTATCLLALCLGAAAPPRGQNRPEDQAAQAETPTTERWYSIVVGDAHVGFMKIDFAPQEGGGCNLMVDATASPQAIDPLRGADIRAPTQGDQSLSYTYTAQLDAAFEFNEGRESVSANGLTHELILRRNESRWAITARMPDGTQGNLESSLDTHSYLFYEAIRAAGARHQITPGARFTLTHFGAQENALYAVEWHTEVDAQAAVESIGGQENVSLWHLTMRTRPPGVATETVWEAWTDEDGRLARLRVPLPGNKFMVIEWKRDRTEANNGVEPFARNGRRDPFNRADARRTRVVAPPPPGQIVQLCDQIKTAFDQAFAANDQTQMAAQLQAITDLITRIEAGRDTPESEANYARAARQYMLGRLDIERLVRLQFEGMIPQLTAALGSDNFQEASRILGLMQGLAADRRITGTSTAASLQAQVQAYQDSATTAQVGARIRSLNFQILGYVLKFDDTIEPVRIGMNLLGGRVEWQTRVHVSRPRGYILIDLDGAGNQAPRIYREGTTTNDFNVGEPLEILRIEQDQVVFRMQGHIEIPIRYPVGGNEFQRQGASARP